MSESRSPLEDAFHKILMDLERGCLDSRESYLAAFAAGDGARRQLERFLDRLSAPPATAVPADAAGSTFALDRGAPDRPAAAEALGPGARIGGFEIERELGRGGMGIVFLARDPDLRRRVALKIIPRGFAATGDARERFRREAEAASRIDHPHLCGVLAVGEDGGLPWIAMRYVAGKPLSEVLAADRTATKAEGAHSIHGNWRNAVQIVEVLARAMHVAHESGIVHRDLKPSNIMMTSDGSPVVLDFGLARDLTSDSPGITQSGDVLGTPCYMAPEQICGSAHRAGRTLDVWALGVILFEALAGRRPFEAATRDALYRRILEEDPESLRRIDRRLPKDLDTVLSTALRKDPGKRYATALALADDLRAVLDIRPIQARSPGGIERAWKFARRRPAVALLLLVLLAGGPVVAALATSRKLTRDRMLSALNETVAEIETATRRREPAKLRQALRRAESLGASGPEVREWQTGLQELEELERIETLVLDRDADPAGDAALRELERFRDLRGATARTEALYFYLLLRRGDGDRLEAECRRAGSAVARVFLQPGGGEGPDVRSVTGDEALAYALAGSARGEHREAIRRIERLLELEPASSTLAWAAAEEAARMQQYHTALAYAGRARVLSGGFGPRRESRYALHLMRAGQREAALDAARRAMDLEPQDPMVLLAYGNTLAEMKDPAAVGVFERLLREAPEIGEAWRGYGALLYEERRFDEAAAAFRRSLDLAPEPETWLNLANAQIELRDYEAGEASVREAIALRSEFPFAWNTLATTLRDQGKLVEARDAAREAVRLDPLYGEGHANLGSILHRLGEAKGAEMAYARALEFSPGDPRICFNFALLLHRERPEEAASYYRKVLAARPDDAEALCNLSGILADRGQGEEAVGLARRACELNPDDPLNWNNLATSCVAAGDLDGAVEALRSALRRRPSMVEPHVNLMLLLAEDDPLAAMAHALEAVAIDGSFAKRAEGNLLLLTPRVAQSAEDHPFRDAVRMNRREDVQAAEIAELARRWIELSESPVATRAWILRKSAARLLAGPGAGALPPDVLPAVRRALEPAP